MTSPLSLVPKPASEGVRHALDLIGITLTDEGARGLYEALSPSTLAIASTFNWSDTEVREDIWNAAGQATMQRDWPTYGENLTQPEMNAFHESVVAAMVAKGWAQR